MDKLIIIGTRGSQLALWQAEFTRKKLVTFGYEIEIKIIKTKGDIIQDRSFDKIEGKGFFTKELEDELLGGTIDLAVHSYKDLPTTNPDGLMVAGCSYSEDPADWLIARTDAIVDSAILSLKSNAVVGTSSARRKSQLLAIRPDLQMRDLRGNVPTRINKLESGEYDAVVLAAAGLKRLEFNLDKYRIVPLTLSHCISAPAQGVLAFQIREDDLRLQTVVAQLHDEKVAQDVEVERGILKMLGGGCQQPIGVYCHSQPDGSQIVWAAYAQSWDDFPRRVFMQSKNRQQLIQDTVQVLKNRGQKSVFISRDLPPDSFFLRALTHYGYTVVGQSLLEFSPLEFPRELPPADWLFFSSKNGVRFFFGQNPILPAGIQIAAIGAGTANAISELGYQVHFTGIGPDIVQVAFQFAAIARNKHVIFPQPASSAQTVQQTLNHIVKTHPLVVYQNTPVVDFDLPVCDILVFTSPANGLNYLKKHEVSPLQKVIAIGTTTAKALENAGLRNFHIAASADEASLVDLCY